MNRDSASGGERRGGIARSCLLRMLFHPCRRARGAVTGRARTKQMSADGFRVGTIDAARWNSRLTLTHGRKVLLASQCEVCLEPARAVSVLSSGERGHLQMSITRVGFPRC